MTAQGPPEGHRYRAVAPWPGKRIRALGVSIRDGVAPPPSCPEYGDVIAWYDDLAVRVQTELDSLDWVSLLESRPYRVTSRAKTLDTLREKLRRDRSTPLESVQDVAGVRFEADMTLDEQDAVAHAISAMFLQPPSSIHDLRRAPHAGYRAVHVWLRLPARVEVQVRTTLQGEWANAYESFADIAGHGVRYGEVPDDASLASFMLQLQALSVDQCALLEGEINTLDLAARALRDEFDQRSDESEASAEAHARIARRSAAVQEAKVLFTEGLRDVRRAFDLLAAERRAR